MHSMDRPTVVAHHRSAHRFGCCPFRGTWFTPRRIGGPGASRALTRHYRDPVARVAARRRSGQLSSEDEPAIYLHEYSNAGLVVRGLVGVLMRSLPAAPAPPS